MKKKKLINKLTPEQESKIPEYRERFRKLGTSTKPCDHAKAEDAVAAHYLFQGEQRPDFTWFDSPKQFFEFIKPKVDSETYQNLNWGWSSNFEAYWVSSYAFINEELDVERSEICDIIVKIIEEVGIYFTFDKHVFMVERPTEIHFNQDRRLHKDGDLAIKFKDGTGVYALYGVRINDPKLIKKYVLTSAEDIDVEEVLQIENVEIRGAILAKIGPARLLEKLNAAHLDSVELEVAPEDLVEGLIQNGMYDEDDRKELLAHYKTVQTTRLYDLYEIDFGEYKGRYLRMKNPSVNEEHVEGVLMECQTVEDALRFRDGKYKDDPAFSAVLS